MRRSGLLVAAAVGVCLAFGLSAPLAQKPGAGSTRAGSVSPAPGTPAAEDGPGTGGISPIRGIGPTVRFLGVTTRRFPMGVGALALSRACNEELPVSRLCEWSDIFRLPPIALDGEVLAAASYETRPAPMCLTPGGGTRCSQTILLRPAACCGYIIAPTLPSPASITLTPADPQTVTACTDTFQFTATAYDGSGAPMAGVVLGFDFPPFLGPSGTPYLNGFFSPSSGLSDDSGEVTTTLTVLASTCESNCAGSDKNCVAVIQAHDGGRLIHSNAVTLIDAIP